MVGAIFASSGRAAAERPATRMRSGSAALTASKSGSKSVPMLRYSSPAYFSRSPGRFDFGTPRTSTPRVSRVPSEARSKVRTFEGFTGTSVWPWAWVTVMSVALAVSPGVPAAATGSLGVAHAERLAARRRAALASAVRRRAVLGGLHGRHGGRVPESGSEPVAGREARLT